MMDGRHPLANYLNFYLAISCSILKRCCLAEESPRMLILQNGEDVATFDL